MTATMLVLLTAGTSLAAGPSTSQPTAVPGSQAGALKLQQAQKQARLAAAKQKLAQAQQKPPSEDRLDRLIESARTRAASAFDRMRNGSLQDMVDRYLPR
jgi:hypothetical protein